ncbi:MAG: YihY/virulence factor BrkB family protein [Pyrinomonadaceae bacterium]
MAAESMWKLGGLTWKDLGTRVWSEINEDDVFGRAAQLAYYFLLALFPLLLFLTSIIGILLGSGTGLRHSLFNYLGQVLPGSSAELISSTMREVSEASSGSKISFGILAALWAASNGMGAICQSLNVAYDVKESRSWWKTRLVAVGLTIAIAVLIISALVLVLYGGKIAESVAAHFGLGDVFTTAWKILQWPIVLAFVLLAFALIYYFAPDIKERKWTYVTPGTVIAVALWLLVSFGFKLYLSYFDSYSATYGSLGAVIVLMLWFYFTGTAILVGGEINSEIENATAQAGAPDAKEKGEKSPRDDKQEAKQASRATQPNGKQRDTATASRTPVSANQSTNHSADGQGLSARKVAVVFGAWLLAKLQGSGRK